MVEKVGSAPPSLGEPTTPGDDRVASRVRHAREAFDRWVPLVTSGSFERARALCESWLGEADRGHHAEAHKCLANVEIASSRAEVQGLPDGASGPIHSPVTRAGVDAAVRHYDAALAATPLDADAHVGRVDILVVSGRYREANIALEESLRTYASRAALENWFKLLGRFQRVGALHQGLAYLKVIEKYHPLDHRVVSNLGAYYAMTGNSDEALAYSERAVALDPDDPINKWNLARIYDHRGQLDDADRNYREALAVFGDSDPRAHCDYVEFIATRLLDTKRACEFALARCEELYDRNCVDGADGDGDETEGTAGQSAELETESGTDEDTSDPGPAKG